MVIYYIAEKRKKRRSRSNNIKRLARHICVVIANTYSERRSRLVFDSILLSSMLNFVAIMCIPITTIHPPFHPIILFLITFICRITPSRNNYLYHQFDHFDFLHISYPFLFLSLHYISSKSSN